MKKIFLTVLLVTVAVTGAYGALGDLVASFHNQPTSGTSTHYGLAADANYLYSYYYSTGRPIYRMRRSNGSLVSSYPCPLGTSSPNYYLRGGCYDGTGNILWINYSARVVAKATASSGSLVSSWGWSSGSRYGVCTNHSGTSGGNYIYTNYYNGDFWKHNTSGSVVSSFNLPYYTYNYDMAWDWNNDLIWCINYNNDWIYGIDPDTEAVVRSFRHPEQANISSSYGIAYWPPYLYTSNSGGTPDEYIWVLSCPNDLTVAPASIGKVKALFR